MLTTPDELVIQNPHQRATFAHQGSRPPPPRQSSTLYRLVQLATDIFDTAATHPPAAYYRDIVTNAFSALKEHTMTPNAPGAPNQDVFGMIMEDGKPFCT